MTEDRPSPRLNALNSSRDIRRPTEQFAGREWVFEAIDAWLDGTDKPLFFLSGGPGSGKTAVAERLVQIGSGAVPAPDTPHLANPPLSFYFFCEAGSEELDPLRFVTNLALALAKQSDSYAQALAGMGNQRNITVKQTAGRVAAGGQVTGVAIHSLTITGLSARLAFDRTIREPLLEPKKGLDSPILILVDGLDEALTYHKEENLVALLANLLHKPEEQLDKPEEQLDKPQNLPPKMRFIFILTGRLDDRIRQQLPLPSLDLVDDAPDSIADVKHYAHKRLGDLPPGSRETLAERIAVKSKGNFLYTRYVLDDLLPRLTPDTDVSALPLPNKLRDIYQEFLERELANTTTAWQEKYGLLVSLLAVARGEGLTRDQLTGMVDLEDNETDKILTPIQQYLTYESSRGPFRIYHQSFREFLLGLDEGPIRAYRGQAQRTIAGFFLDEWEGRWDECDDRYPLRHLPFHIQQAGAGAKRRRSRQEWVERLRALLLDFGWLQAKLEATNVYSLIADYDRLDIEESQHPLWLVRDAIRLSAHAVRKDKHQLAGQLLGRLLGQDELSQLLDQTKAWRKVPWLQPLTNCLRSPGGSLLSTFSGHTGPVSGLMVTPDGRCVISGANDRTMRVWDLRTLAEMYTFQDQTPFSGDYEVVPAAVTPDSRKMVSISSASIVKVWDLTTGEAVRTLEGPGLADSVRVTPDGRCAVFRTGHDTISVWDVETGTEMYTLPGPVGVTYFDQITITPDSRYLISRSPDSTLTLYDLKTGEMMQPLEQLSSVIHVAEVTPARVWLIARSTDGAMTVYDLNKREVIKSLPVSVDSDNPVNEVTVTPNGQYIILWLRDYTLQVFNLESGQEVHTLAGTGPFSHFEWLEAPPESRRQVAVTPDSRYVISKSSDTALTRWDLETGEAVQTLEGHTDIINAVTVTSDGRYAVSGATDKTVRVWDIKRKRLTRPAPPVRVVRVTSDGRYAVSGSEDLTIKRWDLQSGEQILTKAMPRRVKSLLDRIAGDRNGIEPAISVTPDGKHALFGAMEDPMVRLFDLETGKVLMALKGHKGGIIAVSMTPDSRYAVSRSLDATLKVWDLQTAQMLETLELETGLTQTVSLTPDGRYVVAGLYEGGVIMWDLKTGGKTIMRLEPADAYIEYRPDRIHPTLDVLEMLGAAHADSRYLPRPSALSVTPDSRFVVAGTEDGTVQVWDRSRSLSSEKSHTVYMESVFTLGGHMGRITAVSITPDGKRLISGSSEGEVHVWNTVTQEIVAVFKGSASINGCAVTADGSTYIAGDGLGYVYLLRLKVTKARL